MSGEMYGIPMLKTGRRFRSLQGPLDCLMDLVLTWERESRERETMAKNDPVRRPRLMGESMCFAECAEELRRVVKAAETP